MLSRRAALLPSRRPQRHAAGDGDPSLIVLCAIGAVGVVHRPGKHVDAACGLMLLLVIGVYTVLFARRVPDRKVQTYYLYFDRYLFSEVLPAALPARPDRRADGRRHVQARSRARPSRRGSRSPAWSRSSSLGARTPDPRDPPRHPVPAARQVVRRRAPASTSSRAAPRCRRRSSTRDRRPDPRDWFYPNTFRAFALPAPSSRSTGRCSASRAGRSARTTCTTRPTALAVLHANKLTSGYLVELRLRGRKRVPRRRPHALRRHRRLRVPDPRPAHALARRTVGDLPPPVRRLRALVTGASPRAARSMRAMAKITFIGAGSTVFARNLLGDILGYEELAESEITLFDIDAERLDTSELVARRVADALGRTGEDPHHHRPPRRARRRRLRDQHDPGRRLRAVHGHRLRGPEAVRPAPDDRRHARHRRHHARPAHDPGAARDVRRHGGALPRRVVPQLHEPDGDQLPGDLAREQHPHRRAVPQRAGHRVRALARSRHPVPGDRLPRRRHQPHGVLPAVRTRRRRPLPAPARARRVGRGPGRQPRALRDAAAPRLLRHRVERALRRVRAVVHQARPARPHRAVQHPARRVPAPLRRADRRLGGRTRTSSSAATRSRSSAASSTRPRSSAASRPASPA